MSQEKERIDGGPAFPTTKVNPDIVPKPAVIPDRPGMTLRDVFAGQAMQGTMANSDSAWGSLEQIAKWAYELADAMIAARKEGAK